MQQESFKKRKYASLIPPYVFYEQPFFLLQTFKVMKKTINHQIYNNPK